jgi:ABC-2 type transport system permease protein
MMLSNLLRFPMMFLGGVFFDISAMPPALQYIAKALPLTYATEALRTTNMFTVLFNAAVLLAYTVATIIVGTQLLMRVLTR